MLTTTPLSPAEFPRTLDTSVFCVPAVWNSRVATGALGQREVPGPSTRRHHRLAILASVGKEMKGR